MRWAFSFSFFPAVSLSEGGFLRHCAKNFRFLAMIAYSIIAVRVHIAYVECLVTNDAKLLCAHRSRKSRSNIRKSCAYWSRPTLLSSILWYDMVWYLCARGTYHCVSTH